MKDNYNIKIEDLTEFGYRSGIDFYLGEITSILIDLFGEGIIKKAWIILSCRVASQSLKVKHEIIGSLHENLQKIYKNYEEKHQFELVDGDDLIIEFVNGNKIIINTTEWGRISKAEVVKEDK